MINGIEFYHRTEKKGKAHSEIFATSFSMYIHNFKDRLMRSNGVPGSINKALLKTSKPTGPINELQKFPFLSANKPQENRRVD